MELVDRYVKTKYFPDKALDVVDAAGAAVKLAEGKAVAMQDMVKVISKESKIGADVIDIESFLYRLIHLMLLNYQNYDLNHPI